MSISVAKGFVNLTKFLPNRTTLLAGHYGASLFFRLGQNTQNARTTTRSLFFSSRSRGTIHDASRSSALTSPWSNRCSCGCSVHTKGDKELVSFLAEEIANETKSQTTAHLPTIEGFEAHLEGSEVTFTRKFDNEIITVKSNVNHSVDAESDDSEPSETKEQEQEPQEMRAKPDFTVEIEKNGKVLSFSCSYSVDNIEEDESAETYDDSFQITEVSLYSGDFKEITYSVSADIMDGYLYDLLMNYLEERGISNEFSDKMMMFFTSYEHKLYIGLLKDLKKFVEK